MNETAVKRARLRAWRRGFREADLILGPFADARAPAMSADELARFERLLRESDNDIYAWVVEAAPVPPEFDDALMAELRASALAGPGARG